MKHICSGIISKKHVGPHPPFSCPVPGGLRQQVFLRDHQGKHFEAETGSIDGLVYGHKGENGFSIPGLLAAESKRQHRKNQDKSFYLHSFLQNFLRQIYHRRPVRSPRSKSAEIYCSSGAGKDRQGQANDDKACSTPSGSWRAI